MCVRVLFIKAFWLTLMFRRRVHMHSVWESVTSRHVCVCVLVCAHHSVLSRAPPLCAFMLCRIYAAECLIVFSHFNSFWQYNPICQIQSTHTHTHKQVKEVLPKLLQYYEKEHNLEHNMYNFHFLNQFILCCTQLLALDNLPQSVLYCSWAW